MKGTRFLSATLFVLFFSVAGLAQQALKVACVGDSITEGHGSSDRQTTSYPAILGRLLGDGYQVENFGVSGRTLLKNGDFSYWNEAKFEASQAFLPDIVVIKLGTNDTKPQNWEKYGVEFESDLRELVDLYRRLPSQPKVYLCYPAWVARVNFDIRPEVLTAQVIPAIQRVAEALNVSVIDLQTTLYGMPQLVPDGIHPTDLGYVLIAKAVYDRIK
jgi:lysophospholipase L1-like esterase